MSKPMEKRKRFQKLSFNYTHRRSVSLLTSDLYFQTAITEGLDGGGGGLVFTIH